MANILIKSRNPPTSSGSGGPENEKTDWVGFIKSYRDFHLRIAEAGVSSKCAAINAVATPKPSKTVRNLSTGIFSSSSLPGLTTRGHWQSYLTKFDNVKHSQSQESRLGVFGCGLGEIWRRSRRGRRGRGRCRPCGGCAVMFQPTCGL